MLRFHSFACSSGSTFFPNSLLMAWKCGLQFSPPLSAVKGNHHKARVCLKEVGATVEMMPLKVFIQRRKRLVNRNSCRDGACRAFLSPVDSDQLDVSYTNDNISASCVWICLVSPHCCSTRVSTRAKVLEFLIITFDYHSFKPCWSESRAPAIRHGNRQWLRFTISLHMALDYTEQGALGDEPRKFQVLYKTFMHSPKSAIV